MSNFFSKPLEAITEKDVLELQDTPEGQLFEIKETLPAEDARKRLDAWMSAPAQGQSRRGPDDYAKEGLFAELNAFANSEGGWLVLGLEETADKPSRAGAIKPLPECHELADRLQRAAHDWLDPPVPGLQFRGIEAGGGPRDGVIIARVPRSPLAPHRLNKARRTQEAYKRVGDETKPMGMREIQDMTLERALGHSRIEGAFEEARQRYGELVSDHFPQTRLIGFQIVAVPSGGPLAIDRA
ncbi:MAG TPA: ATP-binding protein, partial [Alphaproteobacteria bacterium]|nr:ATP-binding protein [Alphaproteobacteria bacterium]